MTLLKILSAGIVTQLEYHAKEIKNSTIEGIFYAYA